MPHQIPTTDAGLRVLSADEAERVGGARPFGDCNDTLLNFGLFYIKIISCPDGTAVSVGTTLW
jgi:hypothetical protein